MRSRSVRATGPIGGVREPEKLYGRSVRSFFLHLRIPFQLVLTPIFLWGALFGPDRGVQLLLGWVIFHLLLGSTATVFNSYFDHDEGPVAWLRQPPPVSRGDVAAALLFQFLGLVASARIGTAFACLYVVLMGVSFVYSHPSVRLKARPIAGLLLVFVAHGGGAFAAGYLSAGGALDQLFTFPRWIALAASMVLVGGLFPLTQVYQIEEDRSRGDRTFPVRYGWRKAFFVSGAGFLLGSTLAALALFARGARLEAAIVGSGSLVELAQLRVWAGRFAINSARQNHDEMARFTAGSSLLFGTLILIRLFVTH